MWDSNGYLVYVRAEVRALGWWVVVGFRVNDSRDGVVMSLLLSLL